MSSAAIGPAVLGDAIDLARIHRSARLTAMPWLPNLHTAEEDLRYFAERVLPSDTVEVVEANGSIAGFVARASDWINHLYVDPSYWASGYGSALLYRAKLTSPRLLLWTFQGNQRARRFYKRRGFTEVELTDGRGNEEKTPDVGLMWTATASR